VGKGRYAKEIWNFDGSSHLPELQEKLRASVMVRRLKADVLTELPAKRRQVVVLPTNGSKAAIKAEQDVWAKSEETIAAAEAEVEVALASGDEASYRAAVERLRAAQRIAFEEISQARHDLALAKLPAVVDYVRDALENTTKLVVFGHHRDVIESLTEALADVGAVKLYGGMSDSDKQASVDRFQTDDACRVFVGSIQAAGVGLTLTASSTVAFAELDWVPANISQAEDRCHRIGQRNCVGVVHLVIDGSLDSKMAQLLVCKQEIADAALDRHVAWLRDALIVS